MSEIWKPVVGYEGVYEVSSTGLVKRVLQCRGTRSNRILKARIHGKTGYYYVNLWRNNQGKSCHVHALVASAFLGARPDSQYVVNHINHVRTDNRVSNPEWITHGENIKHGYERIGQRYTAVAKAPFPNSLNLRLSKFANFIKLVITLKDIFALCSI